MKVERIANVMGLELELLHTPFLLVRTFLLLVEGLATILRLLGLHLCSELLHVLVNSIGNLDWLRGPVQVSPELWRHVRLNRVEFRLVIQSLASQHESVGLFRVASFANSPEIRSLVRASVAQGLNVVQLKSNDEGVSADGAFAALPHADGCANLARKVETATGAKHVEGLHEDH